MGAPMSHGTSGTCHHGNPANGTCRLCKDEHIDMTLYGTPSPCHNCAALYRKLVEKEAQLCRARKAWAVLSCERMKFVEAWPTSKMRAERAMSAALSSPAPCSHEAALCRTKWAINLLLNYSYDDIKVEDRNIITKIHLSLTNTSCSHEEEARQLREECEELSSIIHTILKKIKPSREIETEFVCPPDVKTVIKDVYEILCEFKLRPGRKKEINNG